MNMAIMAVMIMALPGMSRLGAMGAAGAAGLGAGAESFAHDLADGAGATTALGATAKAAIDLSRGTGHDLVAGHDAAHVVIADDVTGTDNHGRNFGLLMTLNG